ncbi:MAG: nickel transporter permease [Chloroflexia bacterium]
MERNSEETARLLRASTEDRTPKWTTRLVRGVRLYLRGSWLNGLAVALVAVVLFLAVLGRFLTPYSPIQMDLSHRLQAPSSSHPFGTDEFGRDILSRVIAGAGISLQAAITVLVLASGVGVLVGCLAGLLGGWVDEILMRTTDLFLAFPALVLAIAVAATLGPSLTNTMIALSTVYWPWYARLIRGQVLSLREREYVLAARCIGATTARIIGWHLLPNVLPILITQLTLDVGYVVLSTAGLSFLGLGAQPPTPEWGAMIMTGRGYMRESWWYTTFPGLALAWTVLGFNLLGDGLRDFLDPRLRER